MDLLLLGLALIAPMIAVSAGVLFITWRFVGQAFGLPVGVGATPRSSRSRWARPAMGVASGGAIYLVAALLFAGGFLLGGETTPGLTVRVVEGRPAAAAGMTTGDRVVEIAGKRIDAFAEIGPAVRHHAGEPLEVVVEREGRRLRFTVTPEGPGEGRIGVRARMEHVSLSFGQSVVRGLARPGRTWASIVEGFFAAPVSGEVAGPAEIVKEVAPESRPRANEGAANTLALLGILESWLWPCFVILALAWSPRRPAV